MIPGDFDSGPVELNFRTEKLLKDDRSFVIFILCMSICICCMILKLLTGNTDVN